MSKTLKKYSLWYMAVIVLLYGKALMSQPPSDALQLINETIEFMATSTIEGPNSFIQQLISIQQQYNVISGYMVKSLSPDPILNNQFIYSLTSAVSKNCQNAAGFFLDHTNPAYQAVLAGKPYNALVCSKRVSIFGKRYFAQYIPYIRTYPGLRTINYGAIFAASPCPLVQSKVIIEATVQKVANFADYLVANLLERRLANNVVATAFTKTGNEFVRSVTTVPSSPDSVAVGTFLEHDNPAYPQLINGQTFIGDVTLFGIQYFAKYVPFMFEGRLAGAWFAAVPL